MAVKVIGAARLSKKLRALIPGNEKALRAVIVKGATDIANTMVTSLNKKGTGRIYPSRRKDGTTHQASAPDHPPASDTGRLAGAAAPGNSITFFNNQLAAEIGPNLSYARFLELGTANMTPRKFIKPALDVNRKAIRNAMAAAVNQTGRNVSR